MSTQKTQSQKTLLGGSAVIAAAILLIIWIFPILTHHFELKVTDLKYHLRSYLDRDPEMNPDIVLVNLDDISKKESGYDLWPYAYYARVIEKINAGKPTSLGIDILFTISIDTLGWPQVLTAIEDSYVAINPYFIEFGPYETPLMVREHGDILDELQYDELPLIQSGLVRHGVNIPYKPKPKFIEAGGLGFINIEEDSDGILRRIPIIAELNGMLVPHFFLRLLCEHLEYEPKNIELVNQHKLILHEFPQDGELTELEIPLDGEGNMLINYLSYNKIKKLMDSGKLSSIPAWTLKNYPKPVEMKGKTIIFGDHSAAAKDFSNTPLDGQLANPLIYGIAMSNILENDFIQPVSASIALIYLIVFIILLLLLSTILDVFKFGLTSAGFILLFMLLNFTAFIYLNQLIPVFNILLPALGTAVYILIFRIYESQVTMGVLEGSLQSYLSPHLMDKIKNDPDMLKLGGERKRISVLFSDIAGFTSFTDQADPAEVQDVLEEYFSEMTSIVFANKGIVDKYMGDGIMAFFENPPDGVTSAQTAVKSAVDMQEKAEELNEKYKVQNRFPFSVYVGIATGYAKVGNIGPPEKVDYTVIGSVVNRASRLDSAGTAGDILMDEDTYFFVKDDYEIEDFGSHELKGFEKPVQIFRLNK